MISFSRRKKRKGYPKDFEVFYASRAAGGPTFRVYANSDGRLLDEGQKGWKATCPHGETCWTDSPGAFFCLGTIEDPLIVEPGSINLHQVMPIAYLHSYSRS